MPVTREAAWAAGKRFNDQVLPGNQQLIREVNARTSRAQAAPYGSCHATDGDAVPGCGRPLSVIEFASGKSVCSDYPSCYH